MNRKLHLAACIALGLAAGQPAVLQAQTGPTLEVTGLLRTGFRLESSATGGRDGFALYDARLGATGKVGIVFDYVAGIEVDQSLIHISEPTRPMKESRMTYYG